ncbi:hypothetical protein H3C61_02830 [Candidatus Gracilibacteria bacterium]|nr:hypothetical protein [Candidatus Gracilibacteria bacterium]
MNINQKEIFSKQLELFDENGVILENKEEISKKVDNVLLKNKISYRYGDYYIYEIEKNDLKIKSLKFEFNKKRFEVFFDYNFIKERKTIINFTETNKEDRENFVDDIKIEKFKINKIRQKVQNGYGEFKNSVNYFNYLGISTKSLEDILNIFLKKHHLN